MNTEDENELNEEELETESSDDPFYNMSDEEFDKIAEPSTEEPDNEEKAESVPEVEPEEEIQEEVIEPDEIEEKEPESETEETEKPDEEQKEAEEEESTVVEEKEETEAETTVDYKAEYEKLLKPFKASGKDLQVNSVEEAISLMQQGVDYSKKMHVLKPRLKMVKTLEDSGIDADKLNYLLDLEKKDPKAIAKLVKESGIDPIELDIESGNDYKATNHAVSDEAYEIDSVISEIKTTPTYSRLSTVIGEEWDDASRGLIRKEPTVMKVINAHMQMGIYDIISSEADKRKMLGSTSGLSDLELYKQVGDEFKAAGKFNHLILQESVQTEQVAPKVIAPKHNIEDPKLTAKRLAASPTKSKPASISPKVVDYLNMKDEDFENAYSEVL